MPKLNVDFSGVEERTLVPPGDYVCKVKKVELKTNKKGDGKYIQWNVQIGTGQYKGNVLYHITSLKPQALFNLRNTLIACGIDVPTKAINLDTSILPGKILGITVYHEEYEGKPSAKIRDVWRAIKTEAGWQRATEVKEEESFEAVVEAVETPVDELEL